MLFSCNVVQRRTFSLWTIKILIFVDIVIYKLSLPANTSVHLVFHISQLRMELQTEHVEVLGVHNLDTSESTLVEILVQWKD